MLGYGNQRCAITTWLVRKPGCTSNNFQKLRKSSPALEESLDYAHAPLLQQFDIGVRQIELDVYADPQGGRYARPSFPISLGVRAPDDPVMHEPGFKIIHQAVENLPPGPVNLDADSKVVLPSQLSVYRSIEGLIHHFEPIMTNRQWQSPVEEIYAGTETANGELGFYVVADGSGRAWRARTRPPSFIHFAVFPRLMEGHQISDVPAVLGSLNIIAAELDR